jgi:hypothetical protein
MTLNLDPTTPGTLAHARWHKDDDARSLARYEAYFTTSEYTHPYEVVDSELSSGDAALRASDRRGSDDPALRRMRPDGVGRVREPQHRTYENDEGLAKDDELTLQLMGQRRASHAPVL